MDMEEDELREILEEFFTEADESLDQLEQDLIQLEALSESGETDGETVDRLFRVLHTLKGGAGFLSLTKMAKLAHAGENLLDEVRGGKVVVTKPVMDALLTTNDTLKELLDLKRSDEDDSTVDTTELVAELTQLAAGTAAAPAVAEPATTPAEAPAAEAAASDVAVNEDLLNEVINDPALGAPVEAAAPAEAAASDVAVNEDLLNEVINDPALGAPVEAAAPAEAAASDVAVNEDLLNEVINDPALGAPVADDGAPHEGEVTPPEVPAAATPEPVGQPMARGEAPAERRSEGRRETKAEERRQKPRRQNDASQETIRVEVGRLDKAMNQVGELVLARNSLVRQLSIPEVKEIVETLPNWALIQANIEGLSRATQDLQMSVLSTRMQPIKKVFDKIPRQVRELKTRLGREVELVIEGEMTEVDKSLVEDLSDPMVHLIRNALDHGIEPPEDREAAGKDRTGTLAVRAFYEGNNVVVQIAEDGKGIDPEKIKQIAIKKGVITEAAAESMDDQDAVRLILAPGFSTAEQVSDVSGRGVGMDVVNEKITHLQGSIDIKSTAGKGTTISIYLPLTLAIVQALVVASNEEGFAIPIGDIAEVIKFQPQGIHHMNSQDVIELRGEALPLFYLSKLTKRGYIPPEMSVDLPPEVEAKETPAMPSIGEDVEGLSLDDLDAAVMASTPTVPTGPTAPKKTKTHGFVVVVREGSHAMGLVVDQLIGQEEAVVKPVTEVFTYHPALAGATITGDGAVHMILDVPTILKQLSHA
jgi:two-component system chemotaxis sensor kinase CheA